MTVHRPADKAPKARVWPKRLAPYRDPSTARSALELAVTFLPLVGLWALAWTAVEIGHWWLGLLLAIPAAAFVVRLFLIQHDCGHGAFFRNRLANEWIGRLASIVTLTPYAVWRRAHALHHASTGNLDRRGVGDIDTLTVAEYRARSVWGRLRYRLYRHPMVMFGIGPAYLFLLQHRLPIGQMRDGWRPWASVMATNLAIGLLAGGLIWLVGLPAFLAVHMPIMLIAASMGVWLFYVQHQFEQTSWDRDGDWMHDTAALHGSSHYDLPGVLRWFTANIGMHHVHHLSSLIPYYRLPLVVRDYPELQQIGRLTLTQSLRCVRLALWDEQRRRLVSFADIGR